MVHGFPERFKSFKTLEEAETFRKRNRRGGRSFMQRSGAVEGNARERTAENREQPETARDRGAESAGETEDPPENYAFVDGSFFTPVPRIGYGGF